LGTLGGPDATPFPGAINERGQIAGMSYTNSTPGPPSGLPPLNPFLWNKGRMIDLGSLGGNFGLAIALNEHGQVVGFSDLYGDALSHPYIWDHRGMRDLGTLGGNLGEADSINDTGEVAGGASLPGDDTEHAFLWKKNKLKDLGVVPGDRCSHAWSINSSGQVVGSSGMCPLGEVHAFLWEHGEIVLLDDLVFPKSDVRLVDAFVIADNGMIGVNGMPPPGCEFLDDCQHPYVLIPDGECDDTCEDAIAARRNAGLTDPQIRPHANAGIRENTPVNAFERWRNEMRKRYHVPSKRATPSE